MVKIDIDLEVAKILVLSGAFLYNGDAEKKDFYMWKSGIRAPCYCNCRALYSSPFYRKKIVEYMGNVITEDFEDIDVIIGMSTAGISWAVEVADVLNMPFGYTRKIQKEHGVSGLVEGNISSNKKIVIVDDLISSGETIKSAIKILQEESMAEVIGVLSIVNWKLELMYKNLVGYKIKFLCSYEEILNFLVMENKLSKREEEQLMNFYKNPQNYVWE